MIQVVTRMYFTHTGYLYAQRKVIGIQSWSWSVGVCHAYNVKQLSAITIQASVRRHGARGVLHAKTKAAVVIQAHVRMFVSVCHYQSMRRNVLVSMHKGVRRVQMLWRGYVQHLKYNIIINKASMIQVVTRIYLAHTDYLHVQRKVIGIQCWSQSVGACHAYNVRQWKLDGSTDDAIDKDRTMEMSKHMEKQLVNF